MSVSNQKKVIIHKPKYKANFLQIGIDEWQQARKVMTYGEFSLYLYLAGNADGFNLELSRQAFENATGYKKTAYSDAVNKLIQWSGFFTMFLTDFQVHTLQNNDQLVADHFSSFILISSTENRYISGSTSSCKDTER